MTLQTHSRGTLHIHYRFGELHGSNRKRTSAILWEAEVLREGWTRGIGKHSAYCRPFHSTLYWPGSMTCWSLRKCQPTNRAIIGRDSKGRIPNADWNDASSRRRVANPLEGNRRPDQIPFKATERPIRMYRRYQELSRSEAQCKANVRGVWRRETAKMARRSSRDTHFAKDFAFLRFWEHRFFFHSIAIK